MHVICKLNADTLKGKITFPLTLAPANLELYSKTKTLLIPQEIRALEESAHVKEP
jgi:hypothetical protein